MAGLFRQETFIKVKGKRFYGLLMVYRWLALLLPVTGWAQLLNDQLSQTLFGVAVANALLQTAFYWRGRSALHKDFVFVQPGQSEKKSRSRLGLVALDLLVCALLNSPLDSPYYLYSLAALLNAALVAGLTAALVTALILGSALAAARLSNWLVANAQINWSGTLTSLAIFFLVAALAGYLVEMTEQLRKYHAIITRYRGHLERQNQSLERTNQQLEYVSDFNRVLQQGTTPAQVEQLALDYLTRLWSNRQPQTGPVELLHEQTAQNWLKTLDRPAPVENRPGIVRVNRQGRPYWLVTLLYQGEQFGWLALPSASPLRPEVELEEKLLISLLAEQLTYVLGSLKQSQALAVEAERARLAMDMHDVIAQSLFGIAYNLDACLKLLDRDMTAARQRLADLRTLAFDTLSSVRGLIYDLWHEDSGERDFASFLQSYLHKAGKLYPFKIYLDIHAEPPTSAPNFTLSRETQKNLYRVVQEALSNVSKHAAATEVRIALIRTGQGVRLEVHDNGRGFVPQNLAVAAGSHGQGKGNFNTGQLLSHGMGLASMQERVKQNGGHLHLDSAPGQGTHLVVEIPASAG